MPNQIATQDEILKEVLARVLTLPDETELPAHSMSKPYARVKTLPDGRYEECPFSEERPKAIRTVGDLRTIPYEVLLSYPRVGVKTITQHMCKLADHNGIDVTFAREDRVIPATPELRVLHALHHGFVVVRDQCELPNARSRNGGTKLIWCLMAYQESNGSLISTIASEAYHGQPGKKAGIAGSASGTFFKGGPIIDGKYSIVLTDEGRDAAAQRWGTPPHLMDDFIAKSKKVKSLLDDGRYILDTSTDLADRLARMADRERRLEARVFGNGRGDKMSNILSEAEKEIRRLRNLVDQLSA